MSVKIMGEIWELKLPFNKAWVLMAMADHADHEGNNVFPAVDLIAWKTGYSERQAKRIIADLRDDGILLPYGKTAGGVVVYRIVTNQVERKENLIKKEPHRPRGKREISPRKNPQEKRGCQFDTPFYVTHNHQLPISKNKPTNYQSNRHPTNYHDDPFELDDFEEDGVDWEKFAEDHKKQGEQT